MRRILELEIDITYLTPEQAKAVNQCADEMEQELEQMVARFLAENEANGVRVEVAGAPIASLMPNTGVAVEQAASNLRTATERAQFTIGSASQEGA